jgi:ABC-type sugar transport system substrate-binding protein
MDCTKGAQLIALVPGDHAAGRGAVDSGAGAGAAVRPVPVMLLGRTTASPAQYFPLVC